MGLSIHYQGKIKEAKMLAPMVMEVIDFAKVNNFNYQAHPFEQEFPQGELTEYQGDKELYGVVFSPKGCEPIFLTFTCNGRLCSPVQFMIDAKPDDVYFYNISTKTQYSSVEAHILVVDFLRHLSKKYFSKFEMRDEGQYWETQDKALLRQIFERFQRGLDIFSAKLEMIPKDKDEPLTDFIKRMARDTDAKLGSDE